MKRFTTTLFALGMTLASQAQQVSFESLPLSGASTYFNGDAIQAPLDSTFSDGFASFRISHDTSSWGSYWSGWGYSNRKDSVSTLYSVNEMGAIAASGHSLSDKYGVAYLSYNNYLNKIIIDSTTNPLAGFFITNSTISYRSMQNGDGFAKNFGGATGNDPDYFRLDITGWKNGTAKADTVKFYLADFRSANNANDYIIKDWTYVNVQILGKCDSLTYSMISTDTNAGGIKTPTYFCIDDFIEIPTSISESNQLDNLSISPNPFRDKIVLNNNGQEEISLVLFTMNGQYIERKMLMPFSKNEIATSHLPSGTYFIKMNVGGKSHFQKLIK